MDVIAMLADKIADEIRDAADYAKLAHDYRDKYPDLSQTLEIISAEESGHMTRLHDAVSSIIKQYRGIA